MVMRREKLMKTWKPINNERGECVRINSVFS